MTLVRLSGAKSLWAPLVSQLLGEWVASCPLAKGRWAEATDVGYLSLIRTKQVEAVKQYTSFLFPAPKLIGLLMDLNVSMVRLRARGGKGSLSPPPRPPHHPKLPHLDPPPTYPPNRSPPLAPPPRPPSLQCPPPPPPGAFGPLLLGGESRIKARRCPPPCGTGTPKLWPCCASLGGTEDAAAMAGLHWLGGKETPGSHRSALAGVGGGGRRETPTRPGVPGLH